MSILGLNVMLKSGLQLQQSMGRKKAAFDRRRSYCLHCQTPKDFQYPGISANIVIRRCLTATHFSYINKTAAKYMKEFELSQKRFFFHGREKHKRLPFNNNFRPWEDIVKKKVLKSRSIA